MIGGLVSFEVRPLPKFHLNVAPAFKLDVFTKLTSNGPQSVVDTGVNDAGTAWLVLNMCSYSCGAQPRLLVTTSFMVTG